jgi:hypothetical protein
MHLTSRRNLLATIGACFVFDRLGPALLADAPAAKQFREATAKGRRFLEALFEPALDLLPEYRGAKVYWLFHDNYLASKVLADSNAALASKIWASVKRFGIDHSGKIEILFGEAKRPLPFREYELTQVRRIGEKLVKTEILKEAVLQGWQEYADLLFLAAIAQTDRDKARHHFDDGMAMWDGMGYRDRAAANDDRYATYKLALSLIAAAKLGVKPKSHVAIIDRLLALQTDTGGWITDYGKTGKPLGLANVETTCLAILGLEAAAKEPDPKHN